MNQPTNVPTPENLAAMAQRITETLADFGINATIGEISRGPTITRFELHPGKGVCVEKILELNKTVSAALKADCNVFGSVPGKGCIAIEIPNATRNPILLRDLWNSDEWRKGGGCLPIVLGKDVYNRTVFADLAELPHLLIGGRTGSGKSVFIDVVIASLLRRFSPEQLRFVMMDLNVFELQQYSSLPHLIGPLATNPAEALLALKSTVAEIGERSQVLAKVAVRNLISFNKRLTSPQSNSHLPEKLPHIVIVVNEPAELMLAFPREAESAISRITQMGRAVGVHLIFSTRDLSPGTITSKIAANIPARIAFQTGSRADSRTLADAHGPEKLLGKGDMLFLAPSSCKLQRIQAPFITEPEIAEIVASFSESTENESTEKPEKS